MNTQRRGLSVLIVVVLCGVVIIGGVGVYFHYQRKAVEESQLAQKRRVADAKASLERQISALLLEADTAATENDLVLLKKLINRVSILDFEGAHASSVLELKNEVLRIEARAASIMKARADVVRLIEEESFDEAQTTLLQLKDEFGENVEAQSLALKEARGSAAERTRLLLEFDRAMKAFDVADSKAVLAKLQKLGLDGEKVRLLQQQRNGMLSQNVLAEKEAQLILIEDSGEYSASLIQRVNEALIAFPAHPKLLALKVKLGAYPQTVRVPADVASIDEALLLLRAGDLLVLGEGEFYLEVVLTKAICIQGAGVSKTRLRSLTRNGSAITLQHDGKVSISDLSIEGDREAETGHSLILLSQGELELKRCHIYRSSGHGIAVVKGALRAESCQFSDHAWDGVAVNGAESQVFLKDCKMFFNGDHGVDVWQSASATLEKCEATANGKSGAVVVGGGSRVTIQSCVFSKNAESGLVVLSEAQAKCRGLLIEENGHSGVYVKGEGCAAHFANTESNRNVEFGYLIDKSAQVLTDGEFKGVENKLGLIQQNRLK